MSIGGGVGKKGWVVLINIELNPLCHCSGDNPFDYFSLVLFIKWSEVFP